jgi:hypothetical protein
MRRGEDDPVDQRCRTTHSLQQKVSGLCLGLRLEQRGLFLSLFLALSAGALAAPAAAQPPDPSVEIHLEYYQATFESRVRLDSFDLATGTLLDLEDELGLDDSGDTVRGEILFRPGERFRVALDYAAFERDGATTIERQIRYGDVVYHAGAEVRSRVDSEFAALGLGFALLSSETAEAGLSISAAWTSIEASLSGRASIGPLPPVEVTESARAEGAAPMLGVWASGWIGDSFRLSANVRYLRLDSFQDWSGDALDYGARVEWFVLPNLALALGWGGTEIDAEADQASELARAEYSYRGARAGVTFAF